ncbi:MAG: MFS transporter [Desulfuromonas sp.]|nr:MAG: MFS transporter [Desulfuromonas sp.]
MLVPGMRDGLALAYDQIGYMGTGNFIGYLVSVALTPTLLKKLRPRLAIVFGLLLIAVTLAGMAWAGSFSQLLFLYALTGSGSGLANIASMVLIAQWFRREKRGRAAGIMVLGNGVGIILAGLLIPYLNRSFGTSGWRVSWGLLAGTAFVVALVVAWIVRNSPEEKGLEPLGAAAPFSADELSAPDVTSPGRVLLTLGGLYLAFGATYMVYGSFVVISMIEEHGFSETIAGQFWSWVGFFSLFSGIIFGPLSDRIGRKGGLMVVFAIQTLAYLFAGSGFGTWALLLSVFFYGIVAWSIPAIMTAAVTDYLGVAKAAGGFSLITFFFAGGQVVGPAVAGVIREHSGSFSPAFLLSAVVTSAAVLFALTLPTPPRH